MKRLNYDEKIKKYNMNVKNSAKKSGKGVLSLSLLYFLRALVGKEELSDFLAKYIDMAAGNIEVALYYALTGAIVASGSYTIWNAYKLYENAEARQKYADSEINKLNEGIKEDNLRRL